MGKERGVDRDNRAGKQEQVGRSVALRKASLGSDV